MKKMLAWTLALSLGILTGYGVAPYIANAATIFRFADDANNSKGEIDDQGNVVFRSSFTTEGTFFGNGSGLTTLSEAQITDLVHTTDTTAADVCGVGEYLEGNGTCDTLAIGVHTTDTSASVNCTTALQHLTGTGTCVDGIDESELATLGDLNTQIGSGLVTGAHTVSGGITHNSTIGGTTDDAHFDHADTLLELNTQIGGTPIVAGAHTTDTSASVNCTTALQHLTGTGTCVDGIDETELASLAHLNTQIGSGLVTGAHTVSGGITHNSTIGGTTDDAHFDHADTLLELNTQIGGTPIVAGAHTTDTFVTNLNAHNHDGGDGGTIGAGGLGTDSVAVDEMTFLKVVAVTATICATIPGAIPRLALSTDDFDIYTATGTLIGQWRNARTGSSACD